MDALTPMERIFLSPPPRKTKHGCRGRIERKMVDSSDIAVEAAVVNLCTTNFSISNDTSPTILAR